MVSACARLVSPFAPRADRDYFFVLGSRSDLILRKQHSAADMTYRLIVIAGHQSAQRELHRIAVGFAPIQGRLPAIDLYRFPAVRQPQVRSLVTTIINSLM